MAFELAEEKGLFQKDGSSLYSASVDGTAQLCVSFAGYLGRQENFVSPARVCA